MNASSVTFAAFAALLSAAPVWAHHSHAMYDASGEIELEGVITEVRWANPHVWLYLDVENEDGTARTWAMEGAAIDQLQRKDWTRDMLNVGSPIKISCYPLRSGGPGCLGGYVLTLDGETLPPTHDGHAGREFD
jgi:hypothetical protein